MKPEFKRLKPLTHSLTNKIFEYVKQNKDTPVNKIYKALKIEQSVCSTFLSDLRDAKLVTGLKVGREIYYRVNKDGIRKLLNSLRRDICGN